MTSSDRSVSFSNRKSMPIGSGRVSRGDGDSGRWKIKVMTAAVATCFSAGVALANPVGPTVVAGQASFNQQGSALTVTNSANAIIHWQSFSIAPAELTRFIQPSASSAVLNRVIGGIPSEILGALQSNGRVYLINPNGILFGAGARIDVAGLVASTLDLTNQDFLAGKLRFVDTPGAGNLVNLGAIRTGARGSVYLIAPNVENSGLITSPQGEIILAAGKSVELVDVGTPDLRVLITAPDNQAVNLGSVVAESGRIGIYAGLINQKGLVNADTAVVGENGKIYFKAKDITLAPESVTTASGTPGGGKDGGEVRIVADGTLAMQKGSEVHADGGVDGGNGGFLELSGKERIALNGTYTARARKAGYRGGELFLDPQNIDIVAGTGCILSISCGASGSLTAASGSPASVLQVNNDLTNGGFATVNLTAGQNLTVSASPILTSAEGAQVVFVLNMTALLGNVVVNADIGTAGLPETTDVNLNGGNSVALNANVFLQPGRNLAVSAGAGGISTPDTPPSRTIQAGNVSFSANGPVTIGNNTNMLANGSFPRIDLVSRDRAVTVRPGATVLASGSGGVAQVNIVAGTFIPGDCFGFCGSFNADGGAANQVVIDGSVTAIGTFGGEVNILGHSVTVAGSVHAEGRNGNFADVGIAAVNSAIIGSNSFNTSPLDTSNTVDINGAVTATGGDASVEILGGKVNVAGTVSATVNSGSLGSATVAVGAFSSFSSSSSSGSVSAGADNKATIGGTLSAQGPSALVAVGGGSVEVQSGARIDAIASGSGGQVMMGAASSASFSGGGLFSPFVVLNSFQAAPGNVVQLAGTVNATAAGVAGIEIFGHSVNVAGGGSVSASGFAAPVSIVTRGNPGTAQPGGDITVSGTVSAEGGSGEGAVQLIASDGGNIMVNGSITASDAASSVGAAVSLFASTGNVTIGPGATVLAKNISTGSSGRASVFMFGGTGVTVGGSVSAEAQGGLAQVVLIASGPPDPLTDVLPSINVQPGGEVEATALAGGRGQVIGVATGDITVGGNIYAGVTLPPSASGGVILSAGGAIIGAGGVIAAGSGDTIQLIANSGIGQIGAPVRIRDGNPLVSAINGFSYGGSPSGGDVVLSQVSGDMIIGPTSPSAGGFEFVLNNNTTGGIDLSAESGNVMVEGSLFGDNSFIRLGAAQGITVTGSVHNLLGSAFMQAPGAVMVQGGSVFAGQDIGIAGGTFTIQGGGVFAENNLTAAGLGGITVTDGSLGAGSNMGLTTFGNLTIEGIASSAFVSANFITGTVARDVIIRGTGFLAEMSASSDIGSAFLPLTIFGSLRIDGIGDMARMEAGSPMSIHLFFPTRTSGGFFVNGVENQIDAGQTGIFVNGQPAVLNENLFITYGLGGLPAFLVDDINRASTFYAPPGPEEDEDQKKKKPQVCS